MQTYYNTTQLSGDELNQAVGRAKEQEEAILLIYRNCDYSLSPSKIMSCCNRAGHNWPLTSIRRAITNLTAQGKLIKTGSMAPGIYGKPEHLWIYNKMNNQD